MDDPTVRRCINYAKGWGYAALCMTNIFAWRDTDPEKMKAAEEPIGPENDATLQRLAGAAGIVVAAWGTHGSYLDRHAAVLRLLPRIHCLKLTQSGLPNHPLYLRADLTPQPFPAEL